MRREFRKLWILKNLRSDYTGKLKDFSIEDLKMDFYLGLDKSAYLDTVSKLSVNKKRTQEKLKQIIEEDKSIINSCIIEGLIDAIPTDKVKSGMVIRVSPKGDEYISRFIFDKIIKDDLVKAIIVILITGFVGSWFKGLVSDSKSTQIFNIYTTSTVSAPAVNVYPSVYIQQHANSSTD